MQTIYERASNIDYEMLLLFTRESNIIVAQHGANLIINVRRPLIYGVHTF